VKLKSFDTKAQYQQSLQLEQTATAQSNKKKHITKKWTFPHSQSFLKSLGCLRELLRWQCKFWNRSSKWQAAWRSLQITSQGCLKLRCLVEALASQVSHTVRPDEFSAQWYSTKVSESMNERHALEWCWCGPREKTSVKKEF